MTTISHSLCTFDYSSVHWWQLEDCNLICIKSKLGGQSLKAASQVSLIKNILSFDCLHTHNKHLSYKFAVRSYRLQVEYKTYQSLWLLLPVFFFLFWFCSSSRLWRSLLWHLLWEVIRRSDSFENKMTEESISGRWCVTRHRRWQEVWAVVLILNFS